MSLEMEVLFQAGQTCIPNVCPVDEAEEVEESDCGNDIQIDLEFQSRFSLPVKLDHGLSIAKLLIRKQNAQLGYSDWAPTRL